MQLARLKACFLFLWTYEVFRKVLFFNEFKFDVLNFKKRNNGI